MATGMMKLMRDFRYMPVGKNLRNMKMCIFCVDFPEIRGCEQYTPISGVGDIVCTVPRSGVGRQLLRSCYFVQINFPDHISKPRRKFI